MSGENFIKGVKSALPIATGYFPVAISFGLTAVSAGIDGWLAVLMSVIIYAGAAQFVGAGMFAMAAGGWEIIITTFVLNFRHFLMSSSLSRRLFDNTTKAQAAAVSFGITDESFSVASMSGEEKLSVQFLYGLNFTAYLSWCLGTVVGVMAGSVLTDTLKQSLTFGLYALFIGLLIPEMRRAKPAVTAAVVSMAVSGLLYIQSFFEIGTGAMIISATVAGSLVAAIVHGEQ